MPQQHMLENGVSRLGLLGLSRIGTSATYVRLFLVSEVHKYGAVLFRDFPTRTPQAFDKIVKSFGWNVFPYVGGAAPRTLVYGDVFTTNESPPD